MATRSEKLEREDELRIAESILEQEERIEALLRPVDGAAEIIDRKANGRSKTRAARVDRLNEALEHVEANPGDAETRKRAAEARACWQRAEELRWRLAMSARSLARREARKLAGRYLGAQDLEQEGIIGLMRAAKRYDPSRKLRFGTYARWWVRAQVSRAVDHGRPVRLPGCAVENRRKLDQARREYEAAGEEWTVADLAGEVGIDVDRARFLMRRRHMLSLHDKGEEDGQSLAETLPDDDAEHATATLARREQLESLRDALDEVLTDREQTVLEHRYGLGGAERMTLTALGDELGVSRERVRQLQRRAVRRLRHSEWMRPHGTA